MYSLHFFEMRLLYIWVCLGFFLLTNCGDKPKNLPTDKLSITTTTGMIADAVRQIVQDKAKVRSLMGAGTDPHLYKASPQDLAYLREAKVIFYNGLHLEGKLGEVLEKVAKTKPTFAVSDGLPASKVMQEGEAKDPHIWFDVELWQNVVTFIAEKLVEIDAENADFYQKNAQKYIQQLATLHTEVKTQLASVPQEQRVLVTAHDAFGYFGRAYDIEVRGLQGISTLSESGLKDVSNLTEFLAKRKIPAIFVESSVPPNLIEAVVKGSKQKGHFVTIGGTLYSDAMGAENTPEGTYIGMVRANVKTIVNALK